VGEHILVEGVVTHKGKPAKDYRVRFGSQRTTTLADGYYKVYDIRPGPTRIFIRRAKASKPRYYSRIPIGKGTTVLHWELVPYYATEHGPFCHDFRLHRSWGNALDDPMDTASVNALQENTHTLSGILLKPVHGTACAAELVWTVPGIAVGLPLAFTPRLWGGEFHLSGLSTTLLAGYLPLEFVVKAIEIPTRTVLWPIDRVVASRARKKLNKARNDVLLRHGREEAR
jgi:hypothetical protein